MWSKKLTLELDKPEWESKSSTYSLLTGGPWASDIAALSLFSL